MSDLVMAIIGLCGLVISGMTVYAAVQSRRSNQQVSDENGGSLRSLVTSGFHLVTIQMEQVTARLARVEKTATRNAARVADVNESVNEIRRHIGLEDRGGPVHRR